jgi:exosortase H (IPTLxxWG-CTERM-specific)
MSLLKPKKAPKNPADAVAMAFGVKFVVLALLGVGILAIPAVDTGLIAPFNDVLARAAGWLISPFRDDVNVTGRILAFADGRGAVAVAGGCNGVEVCLIMAAALLAFPAPILARVGGVLVCIISIQAINLLRIASLLFLARYAPDWFEFFHTYVWDAVILLDAILIFFLWLRLYGTPRPAAPKAA